MKNSLSLFELEEIEKRLKKWIKSDEDFLDEFKTYFLKDGKLSFIMSGKYVAKNVNVRNTPNEIECTLEDFRDLKTGKPLSEKQKENITVLIDKVEREKKRLFEINDKKFKLIFGDEFFEQQETTSKANVKKGKYKEEELVRLYIKIAIKVQSIPKLKDLEKFASKSTWSRKLSDKDFIIKLFHRIQEEKNAKYNYGDDRIEIIVELNNYFTMHLEALSSKELRGKKNIKTVEFNDEINTEDETNTEDENIFN